MERQLMQESVKCVLELYRELGFENLPLKYTNDRQASSVERQASKDKNNNSLDARRPTLDAPRPFDKEAALRAVREELGDCQRCKLSKGRSTIVFGEGSVDARIMFIGEAPGREEDLQGRPFVGDAGQLLTKLIEKMGLKRSDVYIANIVKCRPPMNRDPEDDEMAACSPFLDRQIEVLAPRVIMSLGKISAYTLMGIKGPLSKFSISRTRGKFYEYRGIPVMPTFHPAYLLRNPKDKWLTWEDAQAALREAGYS